MFPEWRERVSSKEESALKAVENRLFVGDQHVKQKLHGGGAGTVRGKPCRDGENLPTPPTHTHRRFCKDKFKGRTQRPSIYFQHYFTLDVQNHLRLYTRVTGLVYPADGWQSYWAVPAITAFKNYSVLLEKIWKISLYYISVFKWNYGCSFWGYYLH